MKSWFGCKQNWRLSWCYGDNREDIEETLDEYVVEKVQRKIKEQW